MEALHPMGTKVFCEGKRKVIMISGAIETAGRGALLFEERQSKKEVAQPPSGA